MKFLLNHEIHKERWDDIVSKDVNGRIYAYSWYLDGLADTWGALITGDYDFIMPLPYRKKYGIEYVYMPSYVQQLGIYSSKYPLTPEVYRFFLQALPKRFRLVDLRLGISPQTFPSPSIPIRPKTNCTLAINRSFQAIEKGFSRNVRRIVKEAPQGIRFFRDDAAIEEIILFYQNQVLPPGVLNVPSSALIHVAQTALAKNCILPLKLVSEEGQLLAAFTFFTSHGRVYSIAGGHTAQGKACQGTYLFMYEFFKNYANKYRVFDFEGSDMPGVQAFFKKWGAESEHFTQMRLAHFPLNCLYKYSRI